MAASDWSAEMPGYSAFPITVDGVSLDTVAWNIDAKVRQWAGARAADVVLPGVDGVAPSLNDDLDSSVMTLSMWVIGTNTSGLVPLGNGIAQARDNLDQLVHLFGKRHALLDVRETVDAGSTIRQAWCKVTEAVAPELKANSLGRFSVSLLIPAGVWQDVNTADWASTPTLVSGNFYEITTLQGATGPIDDAIITVTGPVTNPQLTDFMTGAYVRLNAAVAAGTVWRLNVGTWASRYAAGLTLGSADTTGTDGQAITVYGGGNARFLRQVPGLVSGARRVQIALTGTGITSATAIGVRARRKYRQ